MGHYIFHAGSLHVHIVTKSNRELHQVLRCDACFRLENVYTLASPSVCSIYSAKNRKYVQYSPPSPVPPPNLIQKKPKNPPQKAGWRRAFPLAGREEGGGEYVDLMRFYQIIRPHPLPRDQLSPFSHCVFSWCFHPLLP